MSKTNLAETAFLNLLFDNTNWANVGDATGLVKSTADGSLYVALYTAAPGEAGGGTEATFGAYARQGISRTAGFTVSGNNAQNAGIVSFPECTSGSETVTHWALLTASSGGDMLYYGALDTSRLVNTGVTVEFAAGALNFNED
jgi:hypothetical protein